VLIAVHVPEGKVAPMSKRKPPGATWESWTERLIREAQERGEFDDLPGRGRPIPEIDAPLDDLWWVRKKLRREGLSVVPPVLAVRREREAALERLGRATTEVEVRAIVAAINTRIREVNAKATSGPPSNLVPLDVEEILRRWGGQAERPGQV
jgi:hypothetical protein